MDAAATRKPGTVFTVALGLTALVTPLAVHLFFPVIPAVKAAFGLTDAFAYLTFSIALFGMAFSTLFYGSLSDRHGRRPVLLAGLSLFLLGSVICGLAQSPWMLVAGRLVQAVGAGCGLALTRAIARDAYRPEHLVKSIAYLTMAGTVGPMVSPFIGGVLIEAFGWRSVFAFAVLAGLAITVIAYSALFETHPREKRIPSSESVLLSYAALFRRARFNAFVLQSGLITGTFMTMASAPASLMTELLHRPPTEFGMYFLLFPVGFFIGNLISSRIGNHVAGETMVLIGSLLAMVTVVVQSVVLWQGLVTPLAFFLPGTFITMSQGIALPYAQVGAMTEVPRFAGTAAGVGVFMQNFFAALFAQLYGMLADGTPGPMSAIALTGVTLCLISGATPFVLKRWRGPAQPAG